MLLRMRVSSSDHLNELERPLEYIQLILLLMQSQQRMSHALPSCGGILSRYVFEGKCSVISTVWHNARDRLRYCKRKLQYGNKLTWIIVGIGLSPRTASFIQGHLSQRRDCWLTLPHRETAHWNRALRMRESTRTRFCAELRPDPPKPDYTESFEW